MRSGPLIVDAVIAVLLAALVLTLSPGLAIVAMLALLVIVICGVSLALDSRRRRAGGRRAPRRPSSPPPARRPSRPR